MEKEIVGNGWHTCFNNSTKIPTDCNVSFSTKAGARKDCQDQLSKAIDTEQTQFNQILIRVLFIKIKVYVVIITLIIFRKHLYPIIIIVMKDL